jgi:phytoene desaturase
MSLVVIYFGTDRRYTDTELAHHNIILGPRYEGLLKDIFHNDGTLADDFSLYLHMPTITDPSIAPEGHENFYVLSPCRTSERHRLARAREAVPRRDHVVPRGALPAGPLAAPGHGADDRPAYFRDTLGSHRGSAFSVEPILTQSAWFRPHNRSEDIPNLYLVGAGTHPGAGPAGRAVVGEDRRRPDRRRLSDVTRRGLATRAAGRLIHGRQRRMTSDPAT